jgi:hypothetical protein
MDYTPQEIFSYVHIRAVAAAAGFECRESGRILDNAGVDLTITAPTSNFPMVHLQVKSTSDLAIVKKETVDYRLKVEDYEKLRNSASYGAPILLAVVLVPSKQEDWICQTENNTALKHCAYWISLNGENKITKKSIVLKIPRSNLFTVKSLQELIQSSEKGEL